MILKSVAELKKPHRYLEKVDLVSKSALRLILKSDFGESEKSIKPNFLDISPPYLVEKSKVRLPLSLFNHPTQNPTLLNIPWP